MMKMQTSILTTTSQIIINLSEGNPGAMTCLAALAQENRERPLVFAEAVRMFDELGLRGAGIYMLWNDCLDRCMAGLVALVDRWRAGKFSAEEILEHVNVEGGRGKPINIQEPRRWII